MLWITSISFVNHSNIKHLNDSEKKCILALTILGGGLGFMCQLTVLQIPERLSQFLIHCPILETMNRFFEHFKMKEV